MRRARRIGPEELARLRNAVSPPRVPALPDTSPQPSEPPQEMRNTLLEGSDTDARLKAVGDQYRNDISYFTRPLHFFGDFGLVLGENLRRSALLIQNQSEENALYINFGAAASVNVGVRLLAGEGLLLDMFCPNNPVYAYFDASTNQPAIIIEGSPLHRAE